MARRSAAATIEDLTPHSSFNTRLKLAIIKSGIPQGKIAHHLGISPFRLSRIVRGRQAPTDDEQDQLAELLREPRRVLFKTTTLAL
jgi:ribosome-binding protein aMBF1 (putative translation factor)